MTVEYGGKEYRLRFLSCGTVLDIKEIMANDLFEPHERLDAALAMLVKTKLRLNYREKVSLFEHIYQEHIHLIKKRFPGKKATEKAVDFAEDWGYICSSFEMDYGIDLEKERYRILWKRFWYLFDGLSSDTKIKQVMRIRQMDMPAPTQHNQKQIQELLQLKAYYALGGKKENYQDGLQGVFDALRKAAQ